MIQSSDSQPCKQQHLLQMWRRAACILICSLCIIHRVIVGFRQYHRRAHSSSSSGTTTRCIDCEWRATTGTGSTGLVRLSARRSSGGSPEVEVDADPVASSESVREARWSPTTGGPSDTVPLPPPLNSIVDMNLERRSVVYEVLLGRDLGFDIVQLDLDSAGVGYVSSS